MYLIFTSCHSAAVIWQAISYWCKLPPIYAFDVKDLFGIHSQINDNYKARIIYMIILTAMWVIWKERNEATFNNKRPSIAFIIKEIKLTSYLWARTRNRMAGLEWDKWCNFNL
ncbi:RNA-directed DNA polymerase, eukaryota, Reverse transcriptase zinc-binding domain protein [Artemisia annua]|uniref:RNA-directed DNA polymerase, eukaryota, Reverse transcriptase zinc-binding domain protein n=1 Tax=Artemisia annua TaxID=35608 RepID=A0A2U1NNB2_ARTAN|nr:RNA-directed DNA polymerase, eukaryota, Reverse transcriptase zinc-binding domain protein [Artemisia annua]